jgi:hypothetical protein
VCGCGTEVAPSLYVPSTLAGSCPGCWTSCLLRRLCHRPCFPYTGVSAWHQAQLCSTLFGRCLWAPLQAPWLGCSPWRVLAPFCMCPVATAWDRQVVAGTSLCSLHTPHLSSRSVCVCFPHWCWLARASHGAQGVTWQEEGALVLQCHVNGSR